MARRNQPQPNSAMNPPPKSSKEVTIVSTLEIGTIPEFMSPANTLKYREERAVAALLTRFKNLITLATTPAEDGAEKEVAASQAFQMEVESSGLVRAAEDLLQLTRELKEMWLFGALRGIGEGEGEGKMEEDSRVVGEMIEKLLKENMEGHKP